MRKLFWENNKIFFAIIIFALIIGGFVYFGLSRNKEVVIPAKAGIQIASSSRISVIPRNDVVITSSSSSSSNSVKVACGAASQTIVTKVIDGDTVVVEGGWHIRLLGMDADEKGYPCYDPAKNRLEELVLAKQVTLEKDKSDVDQYGRCLRYIFLGNENIDLQLVKEGLAVARFYQLNVKYQSQISDAEKLAQQNKTGCKWSGLQQTKQ